jgi:hypothetical protein
MGKKLDILRVNGKNISCPICDHEKFWKRKTLLNTSVLTLIGFDWANREAQNFICEECGYILWFMEK